MICLVWYFFWWGFLFHSDKIIGYTVVTVTYKHTTETTKHYFPGQRTQLNEKVRPLITEIIVIELYGLYITNLVFLGM